MASLEAVRRKTLAFLDERDSAILGLACDLIAAPSPNLPGDETAPAAVVHEAIASLGLGPSRVVAMEPHRPNLLITIDSGRPGPRLGICGHLDTKPVGEAANEWKTDPFTPVVDGDRLYGLGSTDMKGAVAAMVFAAAAVAAGGGPPAGSLTLILTADEEYGSAKGAEYLVKQRALDLDAIVLGEPCGVHEEWDAIRIVSRGISCFKISVHGTQMHSSISDQIESVNAVEAMARILARLRSELALTYSEHPLCHEGPTVNIGVKAQGGVGFGVLPGFAEFWSDIRTIPGMTQVQLGKDVEAALQRLHHEALGATMSMEFADHLAWIAPTEVPVDHLVVRACQTAAATVLGSSPPLAGFPGASDAWPFQGIGGIPTIAAFGPGLLPLAHGPNEWVSTQSVLQAAQMYALLALDFCAGPSV